MPSCSKAARGRVTKTEPFRELVWEPVQLPSIRVGTLRENRNEVQQCSTPGSTGGERSNRPDPSHLASVSKTLPRLRSVRLNPNPHESAHPLASSFCASTPSTEALPPGGPRLRNDGRFQFVRHPLMTEVDFGMGSPTRSQRPQSGAIVIEFPLGNSRPHRLEMTIGFDR